MAVASIALLPKQLLLLFSRGIAKEKVITPSDWRCQYCHYLHVCESKLELNVSGGCLAHGQYYFHEEYLRAPSLVSIGHCGRRFCGHSQVTIVLSWH